MFTVTINIEAIENLINALKPKDRIQLLKHFEDPLWESRLEEIATKMSRQIKQKRITDKDIDRACEEVRKGNYAKHQSHS